MAEPDRDPSSPTTGSASRITKVIAYVIAVGLLAAASWALEANSDNPLAGMIAALIIAVVALSGGNFIAVLQQIIHRMSHTRITVPVVHFLARMVKSRKVRAGTVVALVVLVGAVGGPPAWQWLQRIVGGAPAFADGCPHPSELRLLTSVDGLEPARELAMRYERWTADHDEGSCPSVHAFVYAAPTAAAATSALARSWLEGDQQRPLVTIGPRPDLWLADSILDVRDVRDLAQSSQLPAPIRGSSSIGSSPIVVITQAGLPGGLGANPTWSQLLSAVSPESAPALLAPDPKTSSTGLLAAAGYLSGPDGTLVTPAVARERVRDVVVSGSDTEGASGLLCQWIGAAQGTTPRSVVISDQTWRRYDNQHRASGRCPATPASLPVKLVPQGAPVLDHPLVEFAWSTEKQQALVQEFRKWLSGEAGRQALEAAGLGPVRQECSDLEDNACAPTVLGTARDLFLQAQRPGRVLLALDTSGSMAASAGPAGTTRFTLASRAISQALGQMGRNDQFGLWTFAGAGRAGHQQLVGIAAGDEKHRAEIVGALGRVRLAGDTPLYDTIIAGMREIARPAADVEPRALVVLTDGVDTSSADSGQTMRATVSDLARTAGARLFVVATGEASCTGPRGLREVATIGLGGCFDADPDQLADAVAHLFEVLWKGQ